MCGALNNRNDNDFFQMIGITPVGSRDIFKTAKLTLEISEGDNSKCSEGRFP